MCENITTKTDFEINTERILSDISVRSRVECGLTGISDLRENNRDDRMESFVLSETLKVGAVVIRRRRPVNSLVVSLPIV